MIYQKLSVVDLVKNRYLFFMALFIVISMIAVNFVDYSFLNVIDINYANRPNELAEFISSFEAAVVIFGFLFQVLGSDAIIKQYGMRVALLVNLILVAFFILIALGWVFPLVTPESNLFIYFFIAIAISKLLIRSLRSTSAIDKYKAAVDRVPSPCNRFLAF